LSIAIFYVGTPERGQGKTASGGGLTVNESARFKRFKGFRKFRGSRGSKVSQPNLLNLLNP
jgi:hypothetical protein